MEERKVWIEVSVEEANKINDGLLERPFVKASNVELAHEFQRRADPKRTIEDYSAITRKLTHLFVIESETAIMRLEIQEK